MPPPGWDELLPKEEQSLLWQAEDSKEEEAWHQQVEEQQQDIIWQQPKSTVWPDQNDEGEGWQGGYGPLTVQVSVSKSIASVFISVFLSGFVFVLVSTFGSVFVSIFVSVFVSVFLHCALCRLEWLLGLQMRMGSDSSWR